MFDIFDTTNLVLFILAAVLMIQLIFVVRMLGFIRSLRRYVNEIRYIFRQVGGSSEQNRKAIYEYRSCQFCKHRQSYIHITDKAIYDDFYYKCDKRKISITLADTCDMFDRDYQLK